MYLYLVRHGQSEGNVIRTFHGQTDYPLTEKGRELPCKTLLIAAGLRPERELVSHLLSPDWLHICGNCNTVHPMVEAVVTEGKQAGKAALENLRGAI